jgi:carbamoyltransferase
MLLVADVRPEKRVIPSVTHVDGSARLQTVAHETNPLYHALIEEFGRQTGVPVIINTSFNVRGEPIVCTPADAYRCFMRTNMDELVLYPFLLHKAEQPPWREDADWRKQFALD